MAVTTVVKTIGATGKFATIQLWEDGAPANLVTAERSACTSFAVALFQQGEVLTFVGSGATGVFLDSDSTGVGTGTYVTYGITAGDPTTADVITGATSLATAVLTSGTPDFVGVLWEGQLQNQEFVSASTLLTMTGSTTSTTAYKHLTTAAGCSFIDHANVLTNPLRYNASLGAAIRCTGNAATAISMAENNNRISKLQIKGSGNASRPLLASGTASFVDKCIIEGTAVGVGAATGTVVTAGGTTFRNCAIIQYGQNSVQVLATQTASPFFYNCTIVVPVGEFAPTTIFFSGASGTITVQNCGMFAGDSTKLIHSGSATFSCTTCVSDISGVAGVTQVAYGNEYMGMGKDAMDLRLSLASAQINAGTTDATNAATDIIGTSRPQGASYDIGAWENPNTGGVAVYKRDYDYRRSRTHDAISKRKHR